MKSLSQPGALFSDGLGVYLDSMALIRTQAMGARVAAALGPHRAALLKNHGVVAVGASIEEAVIIVINLENAAKIVESNLELPAADAPDAPPPEASLEADGAKSAPTLTEASDSEAPVEADGGLHVLDHQIDLVENRTLVHHPLTVALSQPIVSGGL